MNETVGIYIHIPFCVRKCVYCDFLSAPAGEQQIRDYVEAVRREIRETAKQYFPEQKATAASIFFGGGTPSLVNQEQLMSILYTIRDCFQVQQGAEISVECNPGTLTGQKLAGYRAAGVNRLSLGLQSAREEELKMLGRIHTFSDFLESYSLAREAGFTNLNVDVMAALPGQTLEQYRETLRQVLRLHPEHISAYSLIVEEGTTLQKKLSSYPPVCDEDTERDMYRMTEKMLREEGYRHYEISNYALPGRECRHNLSYWDRVPYLGFGIGAASLFCENRYTNCTDMQTYLDHTALEQIHENREELSEQDQMAEFMFLGLRKMEGVTEEAFFQKFGKRLQEVYAEPLREHLQDRTIKKEDGHYRLTERGIDVSNVVMADFLF